MKLKHIADIRAGYPFRGKIAADTDSPVLVVQMKDISADTHIMWDSCTPATLTGKRDPGYLLPSDILVAARGNHNYAVQVGDILHADCNQAVAAPHFFVVRLKHREVLPEFLVWLLNQAPCQRYFEQNAEGSMAKSIRRSVLDSMPIVLPSLTKQRTIAAMASTLRTEQALLQQLISNGERLMDFIATDLFTNTEVNA
ncbi:restriction endonuclease subunit S [Pseudomonas sp. C27(2019)]|uniref:restriction endonuclease subunit S n=1 Tax=Pseudomonas sp. C27(2019) TaxID=2604941 RepID=UPI001244024E|nr:restriction endonuclease subunit S [Pseudomonas sp. C27(2019)]QEY58603.1 restriction endonuclease subunit S [Pseudomonas sp. C27(2019)]